MAYDFSENKEEGFLDFTKMAKCASSLSVKTLHTIAAISLVVCFVCALAAMAKGSPLAGDAWFMPAIFALLWTLVAMSNKT